MTDEQFHEFHLDGKQMVFLFMASTVVAVVIFLCGVMVGRGVRASKDLQAAEATAELSLDPGVSVVRGTPPPDLTLTDDALPEPVGELTYPERLAGEVASADSRREPAAPAIDEPAPPAPARPGTKTSPPPATTRPDEKAAGAVEPPGDGYVVQVMALVKGPEAEAAAGNLRSKGYPSFVSVAKTGNARFRVRVGKFRTVEEAKAMKRRLEQEEKFRKLWIPPLGAIQYQSVPLHYAFALVSGLCLALSFPRFGHPAFAWIALVPLVVALSGWRGRVEPLPGQPPLRAFALGLLTGFIYFAGTVYWTGAVVQTYAGLPPPVALLAMLMLALYMAVYPALSALITGYLVRHAGIRGLWLFPAAWVATEYARGGFIMGGFPWVPLGNSQVTVLPVAQLASVLGIYGLSALVALVNASIAGAMVSTGRRRMAMAAAAVALPVACAAWGSWRIADGRLVREGEGLRVGLVQPNIAQENKWKEQQARSIFTTHIAITRDVVRRGAQFVLWPESSLPRPFNNADGKAALRALSGQLGIHLLYGADETVGATSYNSAFLISPDGREGDAYRKIHLVPFGEFIPYRSWLEFFFTPLVETLGFSPFSPGTAVVMLPVNGHATSTAICYEVTYPSLMATAVRQGSELLTTITNDGWYGTSSAPYQHFEMAVMRSIEQGRYLVRAANTGISGIVDPYGRVLARSEIFTEAGVVGDVRLLTHRTLYSLMGDVTAYAAIGLIAVFVGATFRWPRTG